MFGLKKKKEERLKREAEEKAIAQRQKEIEAKIRINKTLNKMKRESVQLEKFKNNYIEQAKKAKLAGDERSYRLSFTGLKNCLSKQKVIDSMLQTFQLSTQIGDMNKVISEFVGGMDIVTEQMKELSSGVDLSKAQLAYETALAQSQNQFEAMDAFLTDAAGSLEDFTGDDFSISDAEIESLISNEAKESETSIDKEIESKMESLRSKIGD